MTEAESHSKENEGSEKPAPASPAGSAPTEVPPPPPSAPAPPASPAGAPPASSPPEEPDWENRFKYLLADFENYRRRSDRDREAIRQRERAEVLRGLLPIHEALDRARHSVAKAPKGDPVRKGLELVAKEFDAFLERNGVVAVASVGRPFDAAEHEAMIEAPATAKTPEGTIVEIVQQGYRFPGGLLRAAKVVVARAAPPPPPPPAAPSAVAGSAAGEAGARHTESGGKK
jgi:molecular chaperone GrpE